MAKEIKFTHVEDLISISALARPGPLSSGGAHSWVDRKNGKEPIVYLHSKLKPYLKSTFGIITYQEQVMKIVKEIGGLSWEDTLKLRKIMGKTMGEEAFSKYKSKFVKGCLGNGFEEYTANTLWKQLITFGSYARDRDWETLLHPWFYP